MTARPLSRVALRNGPACRVRSAAVAAAGRAAAAAHRRSAATPSIVAVRPSARREGLLLAIGVVLVLGGATGCEPYVEGNGVLREETRDVHGAFEGVRADDGLQVFVTAGAAQTVKVSGDENVLRNVDTAVRQDPQHGPVLEVTSPWPSDSVNPLRVTVTVPALRFLDATHAARITASAVAADLFVVEGSDGALLELSGPGGRALTVRLSAGQRGGASLDARGYAVQDATVELVNGARAQLHATSEVSGSAPGGSVLENAGGAICTVTPADAAHCAP